MNRTMAFSSLCVHPTNLNLKSLLLSLSPPSCHWPVKVSFSGFDCSNEPQCHRPPPPSEPQRGHGGGTSTYHPVCRPNSAHSIFGLSRSYLFLLFTLLYLSPPGLREEVTRLWEVEGKWSGAVAVAGSQSVRDTSGQRDLTCRAPQNDVVLGGHVSI